MTLLHLGVGITIHAAKDLRMILWAVAKLTEDQDVRDGVMCVGRTHGTQLPVLKGANSAKGFGEALQDAPYYLNVKHMMSLMS